MFGNDKQTIARMAPMLQRVLVVDSNPASTRLVGDLMRDISRAQVWSAATVEQGLRRAGTCEPQVIFTELQAGVMDGIAFTKQLRRSTLSTRKAPVIMTTGEATAASILAARDAGVHEFLRKPFSLKELLRRLEAVTLRPRDWVEGVGYVGPDRRRFNSGDYNGPLKRGSDAPDEPEAAQLQQALKILKAAAAAVENDPTQALRAMFAQATTIQKVATVAGDAHLIAAAAQLYRRLQAADGGPPMTVQGLAPHVAPLLAYLKEDDGRQAA